MRSIIAIYYFFHFISTADQSLEVKGVWTAHKLDDCIFFLFAAQHTVIAIMPRLAAKQPNGK